MITYAKSYTYFLMHIKDVIKMCNTEIGSRVSTENWYQELAAFFYFNILLPVLFLHKNTIAESQFLPILTEVTKCNCSEMSGSLF